VFKFIQTFITGKRPARRGHATPGQMDALDRNATLWRTPGPDCRTNLSVCAAAYCRALGREDQLP
jgi:hypothetical protein